MMMQFWHYTVLEHYKSIVNCGYIDLATTYICKGELPAVWLSTNEVFEETARKSITDTRTNDRYDDLSRDGLFIHGVVPVRVEIDRTLAQIHKWSNSWAMLHVTQDYAQKLERVGLRIGANPDEWWFSLERIPLQSCIRAEQWNGASWELLAYRKT